MSDSARRTVGLVAVAVLVAAGCMLAGMWQWQRGDDRERAVETLRANFSAEPVPLAELVPTPATPVGADLTWRPATVQGRYLQGATVLLRNRPVDGHPAFHLLTPFVVSAPGSELDDALLVVDRGWIPIGIDATGEVEVPEPPSGEVSLEVRLRPAERESTRTAPEGQAHSIFPVQVIDAAPDVPEAPWAIVSAAYGSLVAESPAPVVAPGALPTPSTDLGPHRSYALQWWMFAAGALVGFSILAWRERRVDEPEDGVPDDDVRQPEPPSRRRRPSAEEEEDALI
ncbi:MAG: SURF1 family protein, partial [Actinomycetota bacterium]|nr:SURF1 family protein [Actinomycetota bacterium]